eukprot:RCo000973
MKEFTIPERLPRALGLHDMLGPRRDALGSQRRGRLESSWPGPNSCWRSVVGAAARARTLKRSAAVRSVRIAPSVNASAGPRQPRRLPPLPPLPLHHRTSILASWPPSGLLSTTTTTSRARLKQLKVIPIPHKRPKHHPLRHRKPHFPVLGGSLLRDLRKPGERATPCLPVAPLGQALARLSPALSPRRRRSIGSAASTRGITGTSTGGTEVAAVAIAQVQAQVLPKKRKRRSLKRRKKRRRPQQTPRFLILLPRLRHRRPPMRISSSLAINCLESRSPRIVAVVVGMNLLNGGTAPRRSRATLRIPKRRKPLPGRRLRARSP